VRLIISSLIVAVKLNPPNEYIQGPSKDDVMKKIDNLIEEYRSHKDVKRAAEEFKEVKIPERLFGDAVTSILNKAVVDRNGNDCDPGLLFIRTLNSTSDM